MTLLVDSGGTKAEWCIAETGLSVTTIGLNPSILDDATIFAECRNVVPLLGSVDCVYFYGSGCGTTEAKERMRQVLYLCFPTASVHVETDMLGACRALSSGDMALIGILGTGSNACLFDGQSIVGALPSLGYILGDYGSANHVGRQLLLDYFYHRMPQVEADSFAACNSVDYIDVIERVYHQPRPNRYLASLAPFAVMNAADSQYCRNLIFHSLNMWFDTQLQPLSSPDRMLHLIGGFAYAIRHLLPSFCETHGLQLGKVEKTPMEGLIRYHLAK
ncbi:MAG: hypothetical protein IJ761_03495 [Bacteroidales bacterium]|nr:hypothetical protein [Bacteroidales bacterium]